MAKFDVVVIGGGGMGCSVAYHLTSRDKGCRVAVVERDDSYQAASTTWAVGGGCRRVFSLPENIALSQYSLEFYEDFTARTAVDEEKFDPGFIKGGYLITASPAGRAELEKNLETQIGMGVNAQWLEPAAVAAQFPSLRTDNLGGAIHSPDDGWLNPRIVLKGLRRKSESLGATFLTDEAVSIETSHGLATRVGLASGTIIETSAVVNAAGAWAQTVCDMVGMKTPIGPMLRYDFDFAIDESLEPLPFVRDRGRVAYRPEQGFYRGGVQSTAMPRGFGLDIAPGYFDEELRPALLERSEAFRSARMLRAYSGLFDQNELDQNAIIGPWTGGVENFYMAAGFSGHGFMHVPGTGQAIAELILHGGFQTVDLSNLGWKRVVDNRPYRERRIT